MITITTTIVEYEQGGHPNIKVSSSGASSEPGATMLEADAAEILIAKLVAAVKEVMEETGGTDYKETPATIIRKEISEYRR